MRKKYGLLMVLILPEFVVAISRVYMGGHYSSDICRVHCLEWDKFAGTYFEGDILKLKNRLIQR